MRLIILIAIALLVFILVKEFLKGARRKPPAAAPRHRQETMVRCAVCSLHIPETEAFRSDDKYFCSNKHLKDYSGRRPA